VRSPLSHLARPAYSGLAASRDLDRFLLSPEPHSQRRSLFRHFPASRSQRCPSRCRRFAVGSRRPKCPFPLRSPTLGSSSAFPFSPTPATPAWGRCERAPGASSGRSHVDEVHFVRPTSKPPLADRAAASERRTPSTCSSGAPQWPTVYTD